MPRYAEIRNEDYMPVARILKVGRETDTSKYGDCYTQTLTLKVHKSVTVAALKDALIYALDEHCTHDYDCCGHWYRSVMTHTLRNTKRREWTVEVDNSKNV